MELTKEEEKFIEELIEVESQNLDIYSDWETASIYCTMTKEAWKKEKITLIGLCKKFKIKPKWNPSKF